MTDDQVNQGATGAAPPTEAAAADPTGATGYGQSPLTVGSESDAFDERPELFVAGAFVGGVVLAQVLRKLSSS